MKNFNDLPFNLNVFFIDVYFRYYRFLEYVFHLSQNELQSYSILFLQNVSFIVVHASITGTNCKTKVKRESILLFCYVYNILPFDSPPKLI